jgi:hypothetical protein
MLLHPDILETYYSSISTTVQLMLFSEIIAIYSVNDVESIYSLYLSL